MSVNPMKLSEITKKLKQVSIADLRYATQRERADFVTVCHALVAEIDRENAREVTKSET